MAHALKVITWQNGGTSPFPPLLFVHGAGHGAWCWAEHFLDFFADRGFDANALSLRGHGGSSGRDRLRWTSIAGYVEDVERVAADLAREPVVVGHSLGGLVVQQSLVRHDPSAAALLASAPPGAMLRRTARLFLDDPWPMLLVFLNADPGRLFSTPIRARRCLFSPDLGEEAVRRYAAQFGREPFRAGLETTYLRPDPARVRGTPLQVLKAEPDCMIPTRDIMHTADAYGAELRILPDLAHDVMLDTGWPVAADALLAWLVRPLESGADAPTNPALLKANSACRTGRRPRALPCHR